MSAAGGRSRLAPFVAISLAIVRGFARDKSSVFFAIVFIARKR